MSSAVEKLTKKFVDLGKFFCGTCSMSVGSILLHQNQKFKRP
jgi:hypothetical protein